MRTPNHRNILYGVLLLVNLFCVNPLLPQNQAIPPDSSFLAKKSIEAVRITAPPKIDGNLDEPFWKTLPVAGDFVEYTPRNGIPAQVRTEARFAYDDMALYIGAMLYDPHPDSIFMEMGKRDQIESLATDYISFDILPYNDQLNMYEFKVSPANLQNDCKYSAVGQDITWDAVWESATKITDSGWIVEVRIPYSALRFTGEKEQVWGFNMWRNLYRRQEFSTWTFVDNTTMDIFRFYGTLEGIRDINPPVRLSFSPYATGYIDKNPDQKKWSYFVRGGMDLKYGISDSYTLDMMLIPDFGQVQSDDLILNLTPFEVRYAEKRQFFTEGTELFNKCDIFYTRRVGSVPKNFNAAYDSLRENEIVDKNPEETRMVNATKISGRNSKGLGIGVFNGMTINTWATLEDTITGKSRRVMTQPFTNYNVLVMDQNLKNNSYFTLINTNYWIPESQYTANVSGMETRLCNGKNTFAFFGRLNVSQKYTEGSSPDVGHQLTLSVSKPSGNFQYELYTQQTDARYDPNDMGFLLYNDETLNQLRFSYLRLEPVWKIINSQSDLIFLCSTLYQPFKFKTFEITLDNTTTFDNYLINALVFDTKPLGFNDYYEPRVWGEVYKIPASYMAEWRMATDIRKPFRSHHNLSFETSPGNRNFSYTIGYTPRIRFSDRISVTLDVQFNENLNNYGWVSTDMTPAGIPVIHFGRRDVKTLSNILTARYIFSTRTSLSLRVRHYWSQAKYLEFYTLNGEGHLDPAGFIPGQDINFNAFTADLQFVWYFAPGSELSLVWKNLINTMTDDLEKNYFNDLNKVLGSPQSNSFSIRILYYIDYLSVKRLFTKKAPSDKENTGAVPKKWINRTFRF
jgi:hypothetical protein